MQQQRDRGAPLGGGTADTHGLPDLPGLLAVLDHSQRSELAAAATRHVHTAGAFLSHEGRASEGVTLVLEGLVRLSRSAPNGREVVLGLHGPGELLGDAFVPERRDRATSLKALTEVRSLRIPSRTFGAFLRQHPDAAQAVLHACAQRVRDVENLVLSRDSFDAPTRVLLQLYRWARRAGRELDDGRFEVLLPMNQSEIASWVGTSRETVSKTLGELRVAGIVEPTGDGYVVDLPAAERRLP
ncbi:MAG: Crp/Fnr family transcriptional regulator [Actinomycetes bacterium]